MLPELEQFSETLRLLGIFSDLHFTWHFQDRTLLQSINPEQGEHQSSFCMNLKRESTRLQPRRCISEHQKKEFRLALRKRAPQIVHCHAGAMELAVPVFIRDEFAGVLCAGTFRSTERAGYREYEEERRKLPVITEKKLLQLGEVLLRLAELHLGKMNRLPVSPALLPAVTSKDTRILKAVIFMRKNHSRKVSAGETAREAGMSTSHFLHVFHRETGLCFSEFLQRLRVESACRLIECSDLPLGKISDMCGIGSPGRFSELFRRYLGESPRACRLNVQKRFRLAE